MKRVIDGKAYNTETAKVIARQGQDREPIGNRAEKIYGKGGWTGRYQDVPYSEITTLYRTDGGEFFFVEETVVFPGEGGDPVWRRNTAFEPVSYDTAYEFVKFEDVDLLAKGIFPTIPEAEDKEHATA